MLTITNVEERHKHKIYDGEFHKIDKAPSIKYKFLAPQCPSRSFTIT